MTAAEFCSWKAVEQNLAGSPCKSFQEQLFERVTGDLSETNPKEPSTFQLDCCFIQAGPRVCAALQWHKGKQCQGPSPALCREGNDHARPDLQWHRMITAFSKARVPDAQNFCEKGHYLIFIRVFHTVIHHPAQEIQHVTLFPYWAAKQ